ncbi:MAG: DNA repair protein RadC [Lachnospiraceae bacterium]|nr:DNA repair protein RadC [Lachnospiraceae bacterium]
MKETHWTSDVDPQTKAATYGISSLTDAELLALVIRNGTKEKNALDLATELLSGSEGFYALMEAEKEDFLAIEGIGQAKAFLLLAVQQIAKRAYTQQKLFSFPIESSKAAADYVMQEMRYAKQEYVVMLMLDTRLRVMAKEVLFIGTLDQSLYSTREIFMSALKHRAAQVILFHNHPSGDPSPSEMDIEVTKKTQEAGRLLDIPLSDHIIIGDYKYYSFREHGMLV